MYVMALGPRCFKCLMLMSSGPVEFEFCVRLMAVIVSCSVIMMGVCGSFRIFLSIFRFVGVVLCCVVLVNCLLKCSAFCLSVDAVVLLNCIVLLCG